MRLSPYRVVFTALLVVAAPLALSQDKPAAPPKPPKEMSQLSVFLGSWTCTGKGLATPMSPEHATEAKLGVAHVLDGYWVVFHYDETKTAANPMPYHAAGFMGYDPGEKVFLERCHDNYGGFCNQTSKGWVGDVLTFEGPGSMGGEKMAFRDIFTKKGADLVHAGEMQGPDGKWMKTDEETCTKAAKK
ncbi:MAG TPA: DUF1579 family protein [Thermoanaerobaculia bacterium]|nr:DUF1579 family protein [Thermoanaerobaculia bacterium]